MGFDPAILESILDRIRDSAGVDRVYGEPLTVGDKTVILVAKIGYGMGGGFGSAATDEDDGSADSGGGGGLGVSVTPCRCHRGDGARDATRPISREKTAPCRPRYRIGDRSPARTSAVGIDQASRLGETTVSTPWL